MIFEDKLLNFSLPCVLSPLHTIRAVFDNGLIASQTLKISPPISAKGWGWGIRKSLLWIANNINSFHVVNFIKDTSGKAAANAWVRKTPQIARTLRSLARWHSLSLQMVFDQTVGLLIGAGVSRPVAYRVADALVQGINILI